MLRKLTQDEPERHHRRRASTASTAVVVGALALTGAPLAALAAAPAATASTALCLWTKLPHPTVAALTVAQLTSDLHQTMKFAGASGPQSQLQCNWNGKALAKPKSSNPEARLFQPELFVEFHQGASKAAALSYYKEMRNGFAPYSNEPGLGNAAAFLPGQDTITLQLVVLSGTDVFLTGLGSTVAKSMQKTELIAISRQILARAAG